MREKRPTLSRLSASFLATSAILMATWTGCTGDPDPKTSTLDDDGAGASTGTGGQGGATSETCPGATECSGSCVNTQYDPANCGDCGVVCDAGEVCSQGSCAVECLGGTSLCGDLCVNTTNDPDHCGGCDSPCAEGLLCSGSACELTCEDGGGLDCNGVCVNTDSDGMNCGECGNECEAGLICSGGECGLLCSGGTTNCAGLCVNTDQDPANCGDCGEACEPEELCSLGACNFECIGGTTECNGFCVDTDKDPANCGDCDAPCGVDEVCDGGACASVCGGTLTKCGNFCVDTEEDAGNCGGCGTVCKATENCISGDCIECDSDVTDCDGDGWFAADGDCCDKVGACGADPERVNPGGIEVIGNGVDDNCNGLQDLFDLQDAAPCDSGLAENSQNPIDFAKALGLCRMTQENPADPKDKTWGLIEAELLRADGTALTEFQKVSIQSAFGSTAPGTLEGQKMVVMSSGVASDDANKQAGTSFGDTADISGCAADACIDDWFASSSAVKAAGELPVAPMCGDGSLGEPGTARDSVMLRLRLRAPTNARSFSFNNYFLSAEYPEFVCSDFNDQFIALVDTPNGDPEPIPNPDDKNLLTYNDGTERWPISINVAAGTNLFSVCDADDIGGACDAGNNIDVASCVLGPAQLSGTGFENEGGSCTTGGGTFWLTTTGNVVPGEIVELRIVLWDVGDHVYDSLALIDSFKWFTTSTVPGTDS